MAVVRKLSDARKAKARGRGRRPARAATPSVLPEIELTGGDLPAIVDAAEAAMIAAGLPLYQRAGMVVRPTLMKIGIADGRETEAWRLVEVNKHAIVEEMTKAARFVKWDGRAESFVAANAPMSLSETYLSRAGRWKLPVLHGLTLAPTLRRDGSILQQPGYDAATGLLYDPMGYDFPPIPHNPTRKQAENSLELLEHTVSTFPFVGDADRSIALSAFLTVLVRRSLDTAPLHAFSAPTPGTGKSLLVDLASILATGRPAGVIAQGKTEEEMEKRLASTLLAGDEIVSLDNCEKELSGVLICQVLSQTVVKPRILGASKVPEVPTSATFFATGNNLVIAGDLVRRSLLCTLDAGVERPELRQFDFDPRRVVLDQRGPLVAAALTVLRAYWIAGRPAQAAPVGGFDTWCRTVRDALLWLGRADPCETTEKIRKTDPRRMALLAVLNQWAIIFDTRRVSTNEVIEAANQTTFDPSCPHSQRYVNSGLREALLLVAEKNGNICSIRLGKWLRKHVDTVVNGARLLDDNLSGGTQIWRLAV